MEENAGEYGLKYPATDYGSPHNPRWIVIKNLIILNSVSSFQVEVVVKK